MTQEVAGLWLIAAGGASNLFEMVAWGQVNDYWHLGRLEFNLPDALIVAGGLWIISSFASLQKKFVL